MRKFDLIEPWTRASKLRFPERTEAQTRLPALIAPSMAGWSGPELPMQVVQP
jgi:hypothetical protein